MGKLAGKVAVITGAGSGMGRAMAELFVREGARVVCVDISGQEAEAASQLGEAAVPVRCDVSVSSDVQRMISTAEERFGRLDILCNNAGFGGRMMPLHEQTEENFDLVHGVNLKGVFLGMKYSYDRSYKYSLHRSLNPRSRPTPATPFKERQSSRQMGGGQGGHQTPLTYGRQSPTFLLGRR